MLRAIIDNILDFQSKRNRRDFIDDSIIGLNEPNNTLIRKENQDRGSDPSEPDRGDAGPDPRREGKVVIMIILSALTQWHPGFLSLAGWKFSPADL